MILIQLPSKGQYGSNPVKGRPYQQFRLNESWVFALFFLAPPSLSLSPANSNQALTCQRVNPLSNYKSCYYHSCNWQSHSRQSRILLLIVIQLFFFLSSIHPSLGAVYRVKHSPRCFLPPPPPSSSSLIVTSSNTQQHGLKHNFTTAQYVLQYSTKRLSRTAARSSSSFIIIILVLRLLLRCWW